jgi:hypothetical protein
VGEKHDKFVKCSESADEKLGEIIEDEDVDSVILSIRYNEEVADRKILVSKFDSDGAHILDFRDVLEEKIEEKDLEDDAENKMFK